MKRKVEKFLMTKHNNDASKIVDENGRLAIGHDVEGCLMAVRVPIEGKHDAKRSRKSLSSSALKPTQTREPLTSSLQNRPHLTETKI